MTLYYVSILLLKLFIYERDVVLLPFCDSKIGSNFHFTFSFYLIEVDAPKISALYIIIFA